MTTKVKLMNRSDEIANLGKVIKQQIDPSQLEPQLTALQQLRKSLDLTIDAAKRIEDAQRQLDNIEATLFVNFVSRDTNGVKFSREEWEAIKAKGGVHNCMFEVLLRMKLATERPENA